VAEKRGRQEGEEQEREEQEGKEQEGEKQGVKVACHMPPCVFCVALLTDWLG
jgi:hypothetical protein